MAVMLRPVTTLIALVGAVSILAGCGAAPLATAQRAPGVDAQALAKKATKKDEPTAAQALSAAKKEIKEKITQTLNSPVFSEVSLRKIVSLSVEPGRKPTIFDYSGSIEVYDEGYVAGWHVSGQYDIATKKLVFSFVPHGQFGE